MNIIQSFFQRFALAVIVVVVACSCSVLDQRPEAQISDADAITNLRAAEAALAGLYNELQGATGQGNNTGRGYTGRFQMISDVSAELAQSVGTWDPYREMDTYAINPDNQEVREYWFGAYRTVNQANNLIVAVPKLTGIQDADKNRILGEAYFVRALVFFDLSRTFGGVPGVYGDLGVPLPLEPSRGVSFPSRASLADSWARVETDLQEALKFLPDAATRGKATKGAANALLARYYLYRRDYTKAAEFATTVLRDSVKYRLTATVAEIYANNNTTESILEMQFNSADQSDFAVWYLPAALGGSRGDLAAHTEFYESIPAGDDRKLLFRFDMVQRFWFPSKYAKGGGLNNTHVLRVAEMFLTRAEAIVKGNLPAGTAAATADLNRVRNRAKLANYDAAKDGTLELAIENERKMELMYEGHRFFDLCRTGRAMTVLASVPRTNSPGAPGRLTNAGRQVMPIPLVDMLANKNLVQNPAYR